MKYHFNEALSTLFGIIFIALSLIVTVETILRKILNMSIQGADELGGYALAVGSTIAFAIAITGRNHIRVDVIHDRLPPRLQAIMNWVSVVFMAAFATLLALLAYQVILDTMDYRSVSQTPWATPLIYPQSVWLFGIVIFSAVSIASALRASWLFARGDIAQLNIDYQPRSAKEELDDELENISQRILQPAPGVTGGDKP